MDTGRHTKLPNYISRSLSLFCSGGSLARFILSFVWRGNDHLGSANPSTTDPLPQFLVHSSNASVWPIGRSYSHYQNTDDFVSSSRWTHSRRKTIFAWAILWSPLGLLTSGKNCVNSCTTGRRTTSAWRDELIDQLANERHLKIVTVSGTRLIQIRVRQLTSQQEIALVIQRFIKEDMQRKMKATQTFAAGNLIQVAAQLLLVE